jgi:hypothetical protein
MEIGRHRGMKKNEYITVASKSYEKVTNFKYLSSLLTNQNSFQKAIKCRKVMLLFYPNNFDFSTPFQELEN